MRIFLYARMMSDFLLAIPFRSHAFQIPNCETGCCVSRGERWPPFPKYTIWWEMNAFGLEEKTKRPVVPCPRYVHGPLCNYVQICSSYLLMGFHTKSVWAFVILQSQVPTSTMEVKVLYGNWILENMMRWTLLFPRENSLRRFFIVWGFFFSFLISFTTFIFQVAGKHLLKSFGHSMVICCYVLVLMYLYISGPSWTVFFIQILTLTLSMTTACTGAERINKSELWEIQISSRKADPHYQEILLARN